jgi:Ca2+-binding EF-hand superfamily protein
MTQPTRAVMAGAGLLTGFALALAPPLGSGPRASAGAQRPPLAIDRGPDRGGEAQDLAFLGGKRPVLLRLHIQLDGRPLVANRDQYVKRWFDFLDRDGDGVLNKDEARLVPSLQSLQQMRANGLFLARPNVNASATLRELDRDGDGKVSLAELTFHFERAGFRPVEVISSGSRQSVYDRPSEVLFQQFDARGQGKLSRDSIRQAADRILKKFDTDDDELISIEELVPELGNPLANGFAVQLPGSRPMSGPTSSFYAVRAGANDQQLGRLLLSGFAKKQASRLSRAESGLDQETFDRLDKNRDGWLDLDELSRWHQRSADVELVVRLVSRRVDKGQIVRPTVEVRATGGKLADAVDRPEPGMVRLTLGDAQISVRPGNLAGGTIAVRAGIGRTLLQQFQLADTKKQGYVTKADLTGRAQIFVGLFPLADRDGDGKVTLAEMTALVNLLDEAPTSTMTVAVGEHGRALFQLLDANGDGRLGLRELRNAWDRLAALDKNGDGFVSADEIPRQFELTVSQGSLRGFRSTPVVVSRLGVRTPSARTPARGPLWFRKMDLNLDGDVSPREFLGTQEEFRRIDADGDGLISVEEAERYDALMREKKETRR